MDGKALSTHLPISGLVLVVGRVEIELLAVVSSSTCFRSASSLMNLVTGTAWEISTTRQVR